MAGRAGKPSVAPHGSRCLHTAWECKERTALERSIWRVCAWEPFDLRRLWVAWEVLGGQDFTLGFLMLTRPCCEVLLRIRVVFRAASPPAWE